MENRWTHFLYDGSPAAMQNVFCSFVGWQNRRRRYGRLFWERLRHLEGTEWLSASELANIQDEELRKLIRHAYETVPYYRELMTRLGLMPTDFRGRADLSKLPVLTKETVRGEAARMVSTAYRSHQTYRGHTSGTTGTALPLYHCEEGFANENATHWRMRRRYGVDVYDSNATFQARLTVPVKQRRPPFWRHNWAESQTLFSIYHTTEANLPYYVEELAEGNHLYFKGYPSFLYTVASFMRERGQRLPAPPKGVFTSSETLFRHHRTVISEAFAAPVRDRYGNAEFCASMVECDNGNLHVDMEFGIVEIVPLEETAEFVRGRMLCTNFSNPVMPFIRYDVGDVATVLKAPCACGRQSTAVSRVEGRIEDYVVTPDGRRIGRMDHIFKDMRQIQECQIVQPTIDQLVVRVVRRDGYKSQDESALLHEFRSRLGDEVQIRVEYPSEIERDRSGKFRAVVSSVSSSQIRSEGS